MCMQICDIVNSRVRVRASLQLGQNCALEFSDMAKSRMDTRKLVPIKFIRVRDMVNSRVCARASLPLLAKIAHAEFAT